MNLDEIDVPTTPACLAALSVATEYCSPALLNHSVRAYLWAVAHARQHAIAFDDELLYVSALLHDLGLVREFDNHTLPFEDAGGHVAWVLGAGAGWPVARRVRAAEVIVRHMWDAVDVTDDPEGHLLEHSTAIDISGRGVPDLPPDLRRQVLAAYPRLDLATEFAACFADQARRKPDSPAAAAVRTGIADRLARNPLESTVD
jgi:hypothetical protein